MSRPCLSSRGRVTLLFGDGAYDWIDVKRYGVMPPEVDTQTALGLLLLDASYRDHYAAPSDYDQGEHSLHGPYRVEAIAPADFEEASVDHVRAALHDFARRYSEDDEATERLRKVAEQIDPLLVGASRAVRLRELGEAALHDWGWVLDDFIEFVVINDDEAELLLIVAGED
jgi:hypothetical protein